MAVRVSSCEQANNLYMDGDERKVAKKNKTGEAATSAAPASRTATGYPVAPDGLCDDSEPQDTSGKTLHEALAHEDMPREKFLRMGPKALTDVDLIAIMLRTGTAGMNVIDLAWHIYRRFGCNISRLGDATLAELMTVKGLGEAKAIAFSAALELGRRRQFSDIRGRKLRSSEDCNEFFSSIIGSLAHEEFHVAVVDGQLNVIRTECVSSGGVTGTVVDVRRLMQIIVGTAGAVAFFVAHNHPSGSLKPSRQDIDLTRRIAEAARTLELKFMDHVIVARGAQSPGYYSFSDNGEIL